MFDDGRVKVWSPNHDWVIAASGHCGIGQYVQLEPGRPVPGNGGAEVATIIATDPSRGNEVAGTVVCSNGTFIDIQHSGAVTVGNDGRDIDETFNAVRESTGGSVMVTFYGSYCPPKLRSGDHTVEVSESRRSVPNRLYPDEREIVEGKIRR
ncbi:hypothetical protein [Gordonia terrae]